ncbi:hypothetical protein HOLleu_18627 [Holothuria leucospilota]|uniref:Uncharacterized protein n=1 Tax=Holothuria leucospilota TaxID=206669 RepID=A0A9Q1C3Z0_HOLLE|nr:hypothetical protein HOLleu_18627 [Holothuria leucospilota]
MAQDIRFIGLSVIVVLTFGFALFVNYLAGAGKDAVIPVFDSSIGQISDKYENPVTPADWTFAIWGLIYPWQFALITYVLSTICRNNEDGNPLYQYPPVISYPFLAIYGLNLLCNAGWCYVFCNQLMVYALVAIVLMALTLYYALLDNSVRVYNYYAVLYKRYR